MKTEKCFTGSLKILLQYFESIFLKGKSLSSETVYKIWLMPYPFIGFYTETMLKEVTFYFYIYWIALVHTILTSSVFNLTFSSTENIASVSIISLGKNRTFGNYENMEKNHQHKQDDVILVLLCFCYNFISNCNKLLLQLNHV